MTSAEPMQQFYEHNLEGGKLIKLELALERYSTIHKHCKIWTGKLNEGGYGVHRFSHNGKRLNLKVHRLMYFIHHKNPIPSDMHVSHLCHVRNCITLDHLSLEPQQVNNSRLVCKNDGLCTGHHGYLDCLFVD